MKKLLCLSLVILSLSVKCQITFNFSLPIPTNIGYEKFTTTSMGDKFLTMLSADTLNIYNSDGSLYRNIVLPTGYSYQDIQVNHIFQALGGGGGTPFPSIGDKLFNSDTLLEFLGENGNTFSVINELGQVLYTFPDSIQNSAYVYLFTINGDYMIGYYAVNEMFKIFSLPGSLPCNQCSNFEGIAAPNQSGEISGLKVYPNPFNSTLEIEYNFVTHQDNSRIVLSDILGKELKTIALNNQSDKLTLNSSDLPKGTIIVSLYGNNKTPISMKIIKIN